MLQRISLVLCDGLVTLDDHQLVTWKNQRFPVATKDKVTQTSSTQRPHHLGDHFRLKGDCGGNLSPKIRSPPQFAEEFLNFCFISLRLELNSECKELMCIAVYGDSCTFEIHHSQLITNMLHINKVKFPF